MKDPPLTLSDCVLLLESRINGSYADCSELIDDLLDIAVDDAMDRQPCLPPAIAWAHAYNMIVQALELAGRGRGCGDADDDPLPRPREPIGGGGGWV